MEEISLSRKDRIQSEYKEETRVDKLKAEKSNQKLKFDFKMDFVKGVHKFYLILALFLGFTLSLGMPLFSEPDGQIHFQRSAEIVGIYPNLTQYGEVAQKGGLDGQVSAYQNGTHFDKYYRTRVQMLDEPLNSIDFWSYNFWGHLIPGVGVWIGEAIYPSVGVMVTVARLFSCFVYSLMTYFIIRFLKRGQLFFATVMLCPVVVNQFASLSYDALSFVVAAAIVALAVNLVVDGELSRFSIIGMIVLSIFSYFAAKTNFILLPLIFPAVLTYLWMKNRRLKKGAGVLLGLVGSALLIITGVILLSSYGGISDFVWRFFITFVNNPVTWIENQVPHNFISTFVAPYPRFNNMPVWLVAVWGVLLVIVGLSEEKFIEGKLLALSAIGIFVLNLLAIYKTFLDFKTSLANGMGGTNYILGVQGRYTTPFYLLAIFISGSGKLQLNIEKRKLLLGLVAAVAILSTALLLFNTLYGVTFIEGLV